MHAEEALDISHAYFIGGSPCSGKSSLAQGLRAAFGLQYYKIDDQEQQHLNESKNRNCPVMQQFAAMSWNEIWMRPVGLQVEEEFRFYSERWAMVLADLAGYLEDGPTITEGAALLPDLLHGLGAVQQQVLYLVPTWEFQIRHYKKRTCLLSAVLKDCRDPERAFRNWMKRDYYFGRRTAQRAAALGYAVWHVDGTRTMDETMDSAIGHFQLYGTV